MRAVFKFINSGSYGVCSAFLDHGVKPGTKPSLVQRCDLKLPGGGGSEVQRALRAKEVNCRPWDAVQQQKACGACFATGNCPSVAGHWVADSFTTTLAGCSAGAAKLTANGYSPALVGLTVNPGVSILLAQYIIKAAK